VLQDGTEELLVSAVAQEQKVNRVAQFALAGLAAVYMVAAPAAQAATVKQVLCASNPTSKVRRGPLLSPRPLCFLRSKLSYTGCRAEGMGWNLNVLCHAALPARLGHRDKEQRAQVGVLRRR